MGRVETIKIWDGVGERGELISYGMGWVWGEFSPISCHLPVQGACASKEFIGLGLITAGRKLQVGGKFYHLLIFLRSCFTKFLEEFFFFFC
jgi:hypothetical protein